MSGLTVEKGKEKMLSEWKIKRMMNAAFRPVGNHSAVKICHYCKENIRGKKKGCYKKTFYGIETDRCLEMSPAITCPKRCRHCWRDTAIFSSKWVGPVDDPKKIIEGCIRERNKLLIGFRGHPKVDVNYFDEKIVMPTHAAISLTGEPCMYPRLNELVDSFFDDFNFKTVFLVTSGTVPERLLEFKKHYPTNIYLSTEAHNKEMYQKLCIPVIKDAWEKYNESMDIMREKLNKKCRTVLRITCMKGLNMSEPEKFAWILEKAQPQYVECKGYMFVGYSMQRMKKENMPSMREVKVFAEKLVRNCPSYKIIDERSDSEVVLLKRIN